MSASTEKKLRQAAREAGTDKKTLALEKEAKEKAKQKRRWTLGTIGVCLLIALILFIIFAKAQAKRSFAVAALILMILALALVCAAFLVFPEPLSLFSAQLRGGDAVNLLVSPAG